MILKLIKILLLALFTLTLNC